MFPSRESASQPVKKNLSFYDIPLDHFG